MSNHIFTGSGVALITPMKSDGSVNYDVLGDLVEFHVQNGTDAIIVCGTTGEAATLSEKEHCETISFVAEKTNGRIPVIAGTGSNDTSTAVMLSKSAASTGVDALLCVTPYYNKTSQQGLVRHFNVVADSVDIPIILYNVPSRTGVNIKPETAAELAKLPRVNGIKEASGDLDQVAKIHELCGDELNIWSGNDDQIYDILERGGKGVISVLSNIAPKETHDIVAKYLDGDKPASKELMDKYEKLAKAMFVDVNPIPVKEAVSLIGFNAGPLRLPLVEMDEANKKYVKETMEEYGLVK